MFLELIATFIAGFAGAGAVMLINRILGGRLPRWLTPVAAGGAMLAATIANEYGWYDRTVASMPEGMEVATAVEESAFYRPWTYIAPYTSRFIAVDTASVRTNDALPGQRMVDLVIYGRWAAVTKLQVLVDCEGNRRADLIDGISLADSGEVIGAQWIDLDPEDPVAGLTCQAEV
ncbi:MAG: hypothetical protein AAFY77_08065 [Pseudomonadota bacterium]